MAEEEFDPFGDIIRQTRSDIQQIEIDISLITNEELRVFARNILREKQEYVLSVHKAYAMGPEGE